MTFQAFIGEFLTFLETREARLLSWGFYNVQQTSLDIENSFLQEAPEDLRQKWLDFDAQGQTIRGVLQQMHQRRLLYLVPGTRDAYRTRFAEAIRLIAHLRQRFRAEDWATGPRLVSDIKIHLTPRTYPRRDRTAEDLWKKLYSICPHNKAHLLEQCFLALARNKKGDVLNFAGFQERAFSHVFRKYGESGISGSMVCAGTGSGKTKAFYVPALLRIVTELQLPQFTKVLAIYPRNVLLADQLREAVAEAEKLRPILQKAGLRPIRFGALLGSTPKKGWFEPPANGQGRPAYHWRQRGSGFVIPYLKSPEDGRSELTWRDADRRAGRTCLFRDGETQPDVPHGVLAMTREELIAAPPDVLFISLEMLNREMGNPEWQRTLGLGQGDLAPRLILLDEVHAYEGIHGAQVAWVLRRWRHWAKARSLHVVGLSATLMDAPEHLSRVALLPPGAVVEFGPVPGIGESGEMESEGIEYNLAVKGDPSSGASLLATSIQTSMLLARMLTPRGQAESPVTQAIRPDVFYRKKVFGFSDNLDSVNRWFSDMSDAESHHLARLRLPLAKLNPQPNPPVPTEIARRMLSEGQIWDFADLLGYDLEQPLAVSRCSSQDPGADMSSDLIIATSSLEVGFDDPDVAVVLHHKRPTSMASFIQRKGRAGRTRGSRPWTVVTLSDYGADRWAFHSAEHLFQPEIGSLFLPIANPYVLRVQVALFLIDWVGQRVGVNRSPFQYLSAPSLAADAPGALAQRDAVTVLRGILELGATWRDFRRELLRFYQCATCINDVDLAVSQLDDLLWHEPRPLMMHAIPALLRKLETGWRVCGAKAVGRLEDNGAGRPMPQQVPKATFMDLDNCDVTLELEAFGNVQREKQSMPITRMLNEACPGRVSKRFASIPSEPGYWHSHSPALRDGTNTASIGQLFPQTYFLERVGTVQIYQPEAVSLVHRPREILDSSNSYWDWQTLGRTSGDAEQLPLLAEAQWRSIFSEAGAFLHANGAWIEMLRYSQVCYFEKREQGQPQSIRGALSLESNSDGAVEKEAAGFKVQADGMRFVVSRQHLLQLSSPSSETVMRFRADYFLSQLIASPVMREACNSFQIEWLSQMSLAMLTFTAVRKRTTLYLAQKELTSARPAAAERVLDVIFQMSGTTAGGQPLEGRLRQTLLDLWNNKNVVDEIERIEPVLWQPTDAAFDAWVLQRHLATLAQSLRSAMCCMSDQVTEDDLLVDVLRADGGAEIFVTEQSSGGLGQIETIACEVKRRPRRFLDAIEHALRQCPRRDASADLLSVLETTVSEARTGGALAKAFKRVRSASGFEELEEAKNSLRSALRLCGIAARRSTVVAVAVKLLRPSSTNVTDVLTCGLNRSWRRHSGQIGLQIPLRTFAYLCTSYAPLRRRMGTLLEGISLGPAPTDPQIYAQIQQMLLEICDDSCPECLDQRNPFNDFGKPSRALTRGWLALDVEEVSVDENLANWIAQAQEILRKRGRVCLTASEKRRAALAQGLVPLLNAELAVCALLAPVFISGVERLSGLVRVTLQIKDFVNG
jgi:hypothetical protein